MKDIWIDDKSHILHTQQKTLPNATSSFSVNHLVVFGLFQDDDDEEEEIDDDEEERLKVDCGEEN